MAVWAVRITLRAKENCKAYEQQQPCDHAHTSKQELAGPPVPEVDSGKDPQPHRYCHSVNEHGPGDMGEIRLSVSATKMQEMHKPVERERLLPLDGNQRTMAAPGDAIMTATANAKNYHRAGIWPALNTVRPIQIQ